MATINAYLTFDGNCREAMTFYRDCLGGELSLMTVGESQVAAQMPKEDQSRIMHAALTNARLTLMASDTMGNFTLARGNDVSLMLYCESEEEIRASFSKLSVGGKVNSELKEEFWGSIYGDIVDKFGMRWMFNFDKPKAKA
jgi:PhnB protein